MKNLTAARISKALTDGAQGKLRLNRHQRVDERVPTEKKQEQVERDLRVSGKADLGGTMRELGETL
jgi:hypothetical protein